MKTEQLESTDFCFPCNKCNSAFDSLRQLRNHQCTSQNPLEAIRLNVSNKIAESMTLKISKLTDLQTNIDFKEKEEPGADNNRKQERYQCIMCSKSYHLPEKYFKHMAKHEKKVLGLDVWFCKLEACEKQFKTNKMLKEHKATAHGRDGGYTCEYCDFKSLGVAEMEGHMVRHMEGIKCCQFCDFTSTEVAYMKKHMEKHNEPNALACPQCGKGYKTDAGLKEHMSVHDDLAQLKYEMQQCNICETTVRSQLFSKHMKKL